MSDFVRVNSIGNLASEIVSLQDNYVRRLEEFRTDNSDQDDINFLNSTRSIFLDYIYLKTIDSLSIDSIDNQVKFTIDLFDRLYSRFLLATLSRQENKDDELKKCLNSLVMEIIPDLATILNYITFISIKYCNKFIENNGLVTLFKYLSNQALLDYYEMQWANKHNKEFYQIDNSLRRLIGSLVCLARVYSNSKNKWKECNSVKIFLSYMNKTKDIQDNKIYSCLAIAFVADDEDLEQLPELKDILPDITRLIGIASKMIQEEVDLQRYEFQLDDSSNEVKEVCCVNHLDTSWSLINLLKALYHLSVSDRIKYDIYYKNNMNKHLRSIIYNGNDVECEYCLLLLWQLCFDKQIAADVQNDNVFYEFILNLSNNKDLGRKSLVNNATGVIWQLNNNSVSEQNQIDFGQKEKEEKRNVELNVEKINRKHIMISYNRDSRDLCLRIKNELEKDGYKIWIDVEDIHGSSLDSMASAIENSVCVLMCMTEKYKLSPNCRAEAEYSFQLNKPIIPLIMQKDYKPDGWLGIILGSKIFVHFMKYDFEECMRRLKAEIHNVYRDNKIKVEIIEMMKPDTSTSPVNKPEILSQNIIHNSDTNDKKENSRPKETIKQLNWTEDEVNQWLCDKNIHPHIINSIRPCDGKLLREMYLIKKETPEFFFKSLAKAKYTYRPVTLKDIAHFTNELKIIFTN